MYRCCGSEHRDNVPVSVIDLFTELIDARLSVNVLHGLYVPVTQADDLSAFGGHVKAVSGVSPLSDSSLKHFRVFLCCLILRYLTFAVPSPGLPGQRFMMLEYRVPVYRNQRCSGGHTETATPNGYCRKQDCLSFLTMVDSWVVSVEKARIISSFP